MKKSLSYVLCSLLTAAIVFGVTSFAFLQREAPKEAPSSDAAYLEKVSEIVALLDEKYVDGFDESVLGDYLGAATVSATGDRWSYYISAGDFAAYKEQNDNAYVGVGITIELANEDDPGFTIVSVSKNSPAQAAGIENGDMLVAVEGQRIVDLGMEAAKNMVRGEEGTDVSLTISRSGEEFDVTITREMIEIEIVAYQLLESGDGYIKINNFDSNCARDTLAAIEDLRGQGAKALIFDLRFNPGGMKHELLQILDYLLPEGPLFRSVDYLGKEEVDYSDENYLDMPMAVIINEDSYSAAEFFAAALQEYEAGVVIGTQTVGKANYQQTFMLSDGSAVAVSTGHYQTPNGVSLVDIGVTPDELVEVDEQTYLDLYYEKVELADDAQLQAAIAALSK